MDPHDPAALRFPLVARHRPACLPLPERIAGLLALADTAERRSNAGEASSVFNQAALLASDLGLPGLARTWCHQHATAYLGSAPLPAMSAIRALEPLVNLARLRIRDHHPDDGRSILLALYEAVSHGTPATVDGIHIPPDLTAAPDDRREVTAWLWRVLLADGTRTLTTTGRWDDALAHLQQHHGIGTRMLDGRQVAVITALTHRDTQAAHALLTETAPGDRWEQAITACLTTLCHRDADTLDAPRAAHISDAFVGDLAQPSATVFTTRLGLTVVDAIQRADRPAAHHVATRLVRLVTQARDGYAARELLAHPPMCEHLSPQQAAACRDLVTTCALDRRTLSREAHHQLSAALTRCSAIILKEAP